VIDVTGYYGTEPMDGFRTILDELSAHAAELADKPQVVVLNKIDAVPPAMVEEQRALFVAEVERLRRAGHPGFTYVIGDEAPLARQLVWPVSAATGAGLTALLRWVGPLLRELGAFDDDRVAIPAQAVAPLEAGLAAEVEPAATRGEGGHVLYRPLGTATTAFVVQRRDEGGFMVRGRAVRRLVSRFDLTNEEAIKYLGERLDRLGVYAALRAQGAQPGDEVDMEGYAFEYQ
jgi:GTP-binding protein